MQYEDGQPVLEMRNITKTFPGVKALDQVSFDLKPGEVHALLGENGAGKSTLIKILGGVYSHDSGDIFIDGKLADIKDPVTATHLGIAMIHQELNVIPGLSVADNVLLGQHPTTRFGFIKQKELLIQTQKTLDTLGLKLSPKDLVGKLSAAAGQLVLISQALSRKPRFLVMDEPTSALGEADIEYLFEVIKRLVSQGVSVIYISHKLDEIFLLSDRVTVLRDGRNVGTRNTMQTNRDELVKLMVGRELNEMYPKRFVEIGEHLLEVKEFQAEGAPAPVSFMVRRGEILGVFGLLGSGRTRLFNALYGAIPGKGTLILDGQQVEIKSPTDANRAGLGLMPLERKREGLVQSMSVKNNLLLSSMPRYNRGGFMRDDQMNSSSQHWVDALRIRCSSKEQITRNLSGGNQQKVVLGRMLEANTKILILNSPTRGIDVGAKVEIYTLMGELCAQGKAVIFVTSEMPELLGLADRILVMANGRFTGEFSNAEADQEKIMHAAIGEEMLAVHPA